MFFALAAKLGGTWSDKLPRSEETLDDYKRIWQEDLADLSDAEIKQGLFNVTRHWEEFNAPTIKQFRNLCKANVTPGPVSTVDYTLSRGEFPPDEIGLYMKKGTEIRSLIKKIYFHDVPWSFALFPDMQEAYNMHEREEKAAHPEADKMQLMNYMLTTLRLRAQKLKTT